MWVIRRVQARVLLYLTELDGCQKKWSCSCFLFAYSQGQATPFCCFSYPEPSECADVENPFNFLTQWKTLAEGLINLDHLAKLIAAQSYNGRAVL